jgi:NAD(P)H-dependent flavin oxidoreductase YrpB (nitropropane dioxygenase family)
VSELLERLGVERPVVQAGMGGGIATAPLAAAVSEAGGLGTLGILPPDALRQEIARAERTGRPVAANLVLPLARAGHWEAASEADAVVTFFGRPKRRTDRPWIHQCGSVEEALAAQAAGADGVIAQGVEAGGHVRGTTPALELLAACKKGVRPGFCVMVAGGIASADDVQAALGAGADAAVLGTRFLLAEESAAHPEYKRRLLGARETVLTELFGFGWPAPHRVVANDAVERWLRDGDPRGPAAVRAFNRVTRRLAARAPARLQALANERASARVPLLGPAPPTAGGPEALLDAGPLYAGETVARIDAVRPAAELVHELSGAVSAH